MIKNVLIRCQKEVEQKEYFFTVLNGTFVISEYHGTQDITWLSSTPEGSNRSTQEVHCLLRGFEKSLAYFRGERQ